jgi:hypothetical protein
MPLQVRRGTDAERLAMTQPLASGELLYVTNEQKLYVGDSATLGGIQITGYTDSDAKDSAAEIFTDGAHNGITFSYNTATNVMTANVNLSNYAGTIRADAFKGSLFADDGSTIASQPLVDAISGTFNGNLVGNVTGNLTGNVTGNLTGNVTGNLTGNVTGNLTGNMSGDVKGSVFGEDSSVIVDATNSSINVSLITHVSSGDVAIGNESNPTTSSVTGETEYPFSIRSTTDGTTPPNFGFFISKGPLTAPTSLQPGDEVAGIIFRSYDGTVFKSTAAVANQITNDADMTDDAPKSDLILAAAAGGSDFSTYLFKGDGTLVLPGAVQLAVYANDAARLAAIPTPVQGMMVFMQSGTVPTVTNKTVVYDGTAWVALH